MVPLEILNATAKATLILTSNTPRILGFIGNGSLIRQSNSISQNLPKQFDLFYNDIRQQDIQQDQILDNLKLEQIIQVERYCYSSWGYIPSGIGTVFKMILFNKAVRDEFFVIHTKNHIIITEYNESLDCQCGKILQDLNLQYEKCSRCKKKDRKNQKTIQIYIWSYQNNQQKKKILDDFICFSKKPYNSYFEELQKQGFLSKFSQKVVNDLNNQFDRAQFYFASKDPSHVQKTMESIFGNYSNKPFYILDPALLAFSEAFALGFKVFSNSYNQAIQCITKHIQKMQITDQMYEDSDETLSVNSNDNNQYIIDLQTHVLQLQEELQQNQQ